MTLEIFSDQLPCVKCGSGSIATKYVSNAINAPAVPMSRIAEADIDNEALQRVCNRCGYAWLEEPLNGKPVRGAPVADAQPA